jgi:hypothetical protein
MGAGLESGRSWVRIPPKAKLKMQMKRIKLGGALPVDHWLAW